MNLGDKLADLVPDEVIVYVHDHPRVMYFVTVPLIALMTANLYRAMELHVKAELFVAAHKGAIQAAASEALGG
jgi:hypothetical protein